MKNFGIIILFFTSLISFGQTGKCDYDFEEKTDSTYIKKTNDYLIYEKDLGSTKDMIQFSLINSDGTLYLNFQMLQKSKDFIKSNCFDKSSKISLQLANGKIITLLSSEEVCSQLTYDDKDKNNIRILNHYFLFTKDGFEDLKKYPVILMKVKYLTESKDYVFQKELSSNIIGKNFKPERYFIDNLKCVE